MKKKNGIKTLSAVLIILGITTIIFTASMIVLFYKFQSIPDTLCERFFTCVVGELGIAGLIQIVKTVFKDKCTHTNRSTDIEYPDESTSDDINN